MKVEYQGNIRISRCRVKGPAINYLDEGKTGAIRAVCGLVKASGWTNAVTASLLRQLPKGVDARRAISLRFDLLCPLGKAVTDAVLPSLGTEAF